MSTYKPIMVDESRTVVGEYSSTRARSGAYQSEEALERELIEILQGQGYEYARITNAEEMKNNLRKQLERLNDRRFTNDEEWNAFFAQKIANQNMKIVDKTAIIQESPIIDFTDSNNQTCNIKLFDKRNPHNNVLQVINQYVAHGEDKVNRYDVTILVNGLPLVHVELKRRGVALKEAFNQIARYQNETFCQEDKLYDYVQIFVISNGTETKYYSNTTRDLALQEQKGAKKTGPKRSTATFEFTSYWADATNKPILDLVDFAQTFFTRNTLLNVLAKYCVFTAERKLLAMRPYQIVAAERIIERIVMSGNRGVTSGTDAGGYIWHTTGSGKTLTSFKTAQLACQLDGIDKVFFVVDRRDLDIQTIREYDKFDKGCVEQTKSTKGLTRQIDGRKKKENGEVFRLIVTTIQQLQTFVKNHQKSGHPIFNKRVVFIFDECHRSQFGTMRRDIEKAFKKKHLFGFTGTPIFAQNASGSASSLGTTEQSFGDKLHAYTIVDAIRDGNVLPFKVDYVNTVKSKNGVDFDKLVEGIDTKGVLNHPERIEKVVEYVLTNFDRKTKAKETFLLNVGEKNVVEPRRSFNSIFATDSKEAAQAYYNAFKKQLGPRFGTSFKVATIFSGASQEASNDATGLLDDEDAESAETLSANSKEFLAQAVRDYNQAFGTNFTTDDKAFYNYYKNVSQKMRDGDINVLIVVGMFLTGFDAPCLNTLWVDKHLRLHGLLQAFSRTNRILNSVKTYGNIVCFRNLQKEVDESIALFGNRDACGIVLLRSFHDYYYGYEDENGKHTLGYVERVTAFQEQFQPGEKPLGEKQERDFIEQFGAILRLRNILTAFDEFDDPILPIDLQDYTGVYNDLHDKYRKKIKKEHIVDDLVFEMELVEQIEVSIDYILNLVREYKQNNLEDKDLRKKIDSAIKSSPDLRAKGDLIQQFLDDLNSVANVDKDWSEFVAKKKNEELDALIAEEKLKPDRTRRFLENAFNAGEVDTNGMIVDDLLPPVRRFGRNKEGGENRKEKKERVIDKLREFFRRFLGI